MTPLPSRHVSLHLLPSHEPRFGSLASPTEAGKCNYPILSYPILRHWVQRALRGALRVRSLHKFAYGHRHGLPGQLTVAQGPFWVAPPSPQRRTYSHQHRRCMRQGLARTLHAPP